MAYYQIQPVQIMKKSLLFILLFVILAFGAFFRLYHLNDQSLWLDEGVTYYNSSADSFEGVWDKTSNLDQSPPGYYFIMNVFLDIFGENEFGFRLIPLIIGLLTVLFVYLLGAAMFNTDTGLFAAILLAINEFHIGFSMESRMYGLVALLALVGFLSLYKALQHETRGYTWWTVFGLSSVAGLYTHNFYVFVLLAFAFIFLFHILTVEKMLGKILMGTLTAILVVVAYIPWIPSFLKQLGVDRYWLPLNTLSDMKVYLLDYAGGNFILLLAFLTLSVTAVIWGVVATRSEDYKKSFLSMTSLIIFLIIGLGAPLFYSMKFEPILKIRYTVYIVPVFMLLTAYGLYAFKKMHMVLPALMLSVFIYFSAPWQVSAYPMEFGEDFRGLVEEVKKDPSPVVVHSPSIAHVINFYNKDTFELWPFPFSDDLTEYNIDESFKGKFLDLIRRFNSFYLVVSHSHENPYGMLKVWSDGECLQSIDIPIKGMEVIHFKNCK